MTRVHLPALLLALAAAPAVTSAQTAPAAAPTPGTADQLAAQMRLLAGNPNDLTALLTAGELSVKLDDLGAAASFFARADRIDPHNGRAKAGEAAILVHAERPGEALRYFAQAESYGAQTASFAAERGLAYDLIGEQERAQRDYRLVLRAMPADEETRRRYALSLAIAGKRELADQELRPLLRQSDRGAWRARAFVLALGGEVAEAERIATTMMPPGTAAGLAPFLERLPTLGPVDRAFAVHFGEVRSTPERVADARKAPPLAALGPDPHAPRVTVAAAPPDKGKKRPDKKQRGKPQPVQVAVVIPAPEPLPQAPAYRPAPGSPPVLASRGTAPAAWPTAVRSDAPSSRAPERVAARAAQAPDAAPATATPTRSLAGTTTLSTPGAAIAAAAPRQATPPPSRAPLPALAPPPEVNTTVASNVPVTTPPATPPVARPTVATATPLRTAPAVTPTSPPPANAAIASSVTTEAPVASSLSPRPAPAAAAPPTTTPVAASTAASETPAAVAPTSIIPDPPVSVAAASPSPSGEAAAVPPSAAVAVQPSLAAAALPPRAAPTAVPRDDGAVSRIVAALPIPGAELGVAPPAAAREPVAAPRAPVAAAPDPAVEKAAAELAAKKALADKRAADRKAAAEKKALADKKAAAAKKAEEEREAAAQRKLERANPERIWVQVAGGANEHDLTKAWAAAKAKGGDAFAGHATGWTTPLRFTNRVLAGPFKTGEEARAFVNKLKAAGMSTFTFTSDAGQVVTKLSAE